MTYLHHTILIYVLVIAFIVPVILDGSGETDNVLNASLVNVILASCSVMDGYYILLFNNMTKRRFVERKRKCVTDIFADYGPYYTRWAYCMNEMQFWKLYNILYKFYPKKRKKRKRGTDNNTSANGTIHLSLRLSISIWYFAGVSSIELMISHGTYCIM